VATNIRFVKLCNHVLALGKMCFRNSSSAQSSVSLFRYIGRVLAGPLWVRQFRRGRGEGGGGEDNDDEEIGRGAEGKRIRRKRSRRTRRKRI
jgi:hypothetical protein